MHPERAVKITFKFTLAQGKTLDMLINHKEFPVDQEKIAEIKGKSSTQYKTEDPLTILQLIKQLNPTSATNYALGMNRNIRLDDLQRYIEEAFDIQAKTEGTDAEPSESNKCQGILKTPGSR